MKNDLLEVFRNNRGEQNKVENFIRTLGEPKKHSNMEEVVIDAHANYVNYLVNGASHGQQKYVTKEYFKPAMKLVDVPESSWAPTTGTVTATTQESTTTATTLCNTRTQTPTLTPIQASISAQQSSKVPGGPELGYPAKRPQFQCHSL